MIVLFGGISPLVVWMIDPYHLFHETRWNTNLHPFDNGNIYYIGAVRRNIVQSNEHNGIIVGSSHTAGFAIEDVDVAMGAQASVMLCLGLGQSQPLAFWAEQALASGKIKYVLWGIDAFAFFKNPPVSPEMRERLKHPLISSFDSAVWLTTSHVIMHRLKLCTKTACFSDYDFTVKTIVPDRSKACKNWIRNDNLLKQRRLLPDFSKFSLANNHLFCDIDCLLRLIRRYPNVQFFLPITPVSWVWCRFFQGIHHPYFLQASFTFWRHLVTTCADLPNVKIYGWYDCAFVNNLANYFDPAHYHHDINRYMAWCIEHDKHRLTKENYDAYEARCVENLRAFKIQDAYPHRDTFDELVAAEAQN
ncbi:MAG: hypothetical protein MJ218_03930 [Opitutales bacterium]|nr:hypothetical protein [Opitutales bacterium]